MSENVQESLNALSAKLASLRSLDVNGTNRAEKLRGDSTQASRNENSGTSSYLCMICKRPKHMEVFFGGKGSWKIWHATPKAFKEAAERGCSRCGLISDAIITCTDGVSDIDGGSVEVTVWPLDYDTAQEQADQDLIRVSVRIVGNNGGDFELFRIEGTLR